MRWWKFYLVVFFVMALLFRGKGVFLAAYIMLIFHFGVRKLLDYALSRLEISRPKDKTRLFPGENAELVVTIKNPTLVPITWLSGYEHLPVELEEGRINHWVASLPPRTSIEVRYLIMGRDRGVYVAGPIDLALGDALGLHTRGNQIDSFHEVVVYPRIHPLRELGLPSRLPFGNVRALRQIYPDPSRLAGVRPYESGDRLQSIHWKATARTGQLQVKLFEHTVSLDTVLLLNMNEDDYDVHSFLPDSELAVETAASLANYLSTQGEPFAFVTNARFRARITAEDVGQTDEEANPAQKGAIPAGNADTSNSSTFRLLPRKGTAQLMRVLEALAAVDCRRAMAFPEMVANEARHFSWGAILLLITPVDSEELIQTCISLTKSGYHALIFVTGQQIRHKELLNRPDHASLQLFRVKKRGTLSLQKHA